MPMPVPHKIWLALVVACLLAPLPVAQVTKPAPTDAHSGESPAFRSNVNLVNLYFNVKDKQGSPIHGLSKDDFLVTDNGRPQVIRYFKAESSRPLTLGLLIDTSYSMTEAMAAEQEIAAELLRQVLGENDQACVVAFNWHILLLQDFTGSAGKLMKALEKTYVRMGPAYLSRSYRQAELDRMLLDEGRHEEALYLPVGPFTRLHDAVAATARRKLNAENGLKVMVVLTDGEDEGSRESIKPAIRAAQEADAVVYVILFPAQAFRGDIGRIWPWAADWGDYPGFGKGEMQQLARETGGRVVKVEKDRTMLKEAFAQVADELHSQYYLGYTPDETNFDGKFHKVEIKTGNPDRRVQSRTGYYARKPQD